MNFLDDAAAVSQLERLGDAATWPAAFAEAGGEGSERLHDAPTAGGERLVVQIGPELARERLWIQCDAWRMPATAAAVAWAIAQALGDSEPSRYRQLALTRARFAVVGPSAAPRAVTGAVPLLDGGVLGASTAVLAAMDRFVPTLVVHLQDWGEETGAAGVAGQAAVAGEPGRRLRLVESFHLDPELHRQLASGARRRWGRPTPTARALAAHPEARLGQLVHGHARRMGARFEEVATPGTGSQPPEGALRLAPARYAVRAEWRLLGAANLCELALARYGAAGICAQDPSGAPAERVHALLAVAEGAILHRLGLEMAEAAA